MEHEIIRDHGTKKSRGFGFIVFENEKVVDNLLENGNRIDMAGTQVISLLGFLMISGVCGHDFTLYKEANKDCILNCSLIGKSSPIPQDRFSKIICL